VAVAFRALAFGVGPGLLVALVERLALRPALEVVLAAPAGVDEVAVVAVDRAEQLEALETVGALDEARAPGEATLQLVAHGLRHGQDVDLYDAHGGILARPGPRRTKGAGRGGDG
jgi:hypothetical protein